MAYTHFVTRDWDSDNGGTKMTDVNPYISPDVRSAEPSIGDRHRRRLAVWNVLAVTWATAGLAAMAVCLVFTFVVDGSLFELLTFATDDAYMLAFLTAIPISLFVAVGAALGQWTRSRLVQYVATLLPLLSLAGALAFADLTSNEANRARLIFAYCVITGSCAAAPVLFVRTKWRRKTLMLASLPHLLVVFGYMMVVMGRHLR